MGSKGSTKQRVMKDGLNPVSIRRLATNLAQGDKNFPVKAFVERASTGLESLELKARVAKISGDLHAVLNRSFSAACELFVNALDDWDPGEEGDSLRGFAAWPLFRFVQDYGLDEPELALDTLAQMTHLFTAEFAVRPFIERHPQISMKKIAAWTQSESDAIRRLASEGIRPRLPWGGHLSAFQIDPRPVFGILEKLKDDRSDYVCRSVGNCLSDVAVTHPEEVIALCKKWVKKKQNKRGWIAKRATRNLIKKGHPDVWALHGFTENPKTVVDAFAIDRERIELGETLTMQVALSSSSKQEERIALDYVVFHQKANGTQSPKVFKWKELSLKAGERLQLSKTHTIRAITTRRYYAGEHRIEVQLNGKRMKEVSFELKMDR